MSDQLPIWINGEVSDRLPADDRGLAYGDGVFETIRVAPRPVLEQFHFDRLAKGLAALGLVIDQTMLYRFYSDYLNQHQPELIKLIITRGSGGRRNRVGFDKITSAQFHSPSSSSARSSNWW